jgi:hypothetical protein
MKIRFYFAWYDLWFGAYVDRAMRTVYIGIPMFGIKVIFRPTCHGYCGPKRRGARCDRCLWFTECLLRDILK